DELRATAPADAAPLQDAKSEDDGGGDKLYVAGKHGKKMAAVLGDDNGDGGSATRGKPVAPSDDEAGVIAESAARKIVLAAATGNRRAEFGHRRRAEKRVKSASDPHTNKQPRIRKTLRNFAGRSNDSGGNRI